jgi:serine/threonine protein kinase
MILAKKYEIQDLLGGGRFGFVYKGVHQKNKTFVAIKVESSCTTHILKHETTLLKYLYDQGVRTIPTVYWFGVIHSHAFLVMTYYDRCLYHLYHDPEHPIPFEKSVRFMQQAISILKSIHEKHVLHRDIKPHNFMIRGEELCLIDFGLAIVWDEEANVEKEEESVIGTPKYASFFIHRGEAYQRRDDLISLGYMFLEWIGGNRSLSWDCDGGEPKKKEEYILLKSWEKMEPWARQISQEGTRFLNYCYGLKMGEKPGYHF